MLNIQLLTEQVCGGLCSNMSVILCRVVSVLFYDRKQHKLARRPGLDILLCDLECVSFDWSRV